jgi:hypothetical protein
MEKLRELQSPEVRTAIERVGLSKRTVTIDVNGTLIADDLTEEAQLDTLLLAEFQAEVARLQAGGWDVGLNSDSPYEVLLEFAAKLGLENAVIIAEGGNIVSKGDQGVIFRELEDRDAVMGQIERVAAGAGYTRVADAASPEFGGTQPDYSQREYAFGRGRMTSVSVLGESDLIKILAANQTDIVPDECSADWSPSYGFAGIQPGNDYRQNKGQTMGMIAEALSVGKGDDPGELVHIGNSGSDWTDPATGVRTMFIGGEDRRIKDYMNDGTNCTELAGMAGVIDLLRRLQ